MKAAYRFFSNPRVTPSKILAPHIELTKLRTRGSNRVLVANDTCYFNFSTHLTTSGLTELGHDKTKLYGNSHCTVVEVSEEGTPEGREKIEWRLLTNLPITSIEDIAEVIGYYKLRWRIEEFHRILKSGCTVEKILLNTASRLGNAIALYSTIAWRIFWMTHLARVDPDADASKVLTNSEIQSLKNLKRFEGKVAKNLTVKQAILLVGRLGGFIKTKRYPSPGNTTVWRGFTQLTAMSEMYESLTGGRSYG